MDREGKTMNLLDLVPTVSNIIDRFVPDPNKAAEMKLELAKIEASEYVAKMETQKAWLGNTNWFVSGAIPAILWMISLVVFFNHILGPLLKGGGLAVPIMALPEWYYDLAKLIIGGLFAKKVIDNNEWWIGGKLVSPSKKTVEAAIQGGKAAPVGESVTLKKTEELVEQRLAAMKAELESGNKAKK